MTQTRAEIEWRRVRNVTRVCSTRYRVHSLKPVLEQKGGAGVAKNGETIAKHTHEENSEELYNVQHSKINERGKKGVRYHVSDSRVYPFRRSRTSPELTLHRNVRQEQLSGLTRSPQVELHNVSSVGFRSKTKRSSPDFGNCGGYHDANRPGTSQQSYLCDSRKTKSEMARPKTWTGGRDRSSFYPDKTSAELLIDNTSDANNDHTQWAHRKITSRVDELALPRFRGLAKSQRQKRPRSLLELRHLDLADYDALRHAEKHARPWQWL